MGLEQWMYASTCNEPGTDVFDSILESSRRNNDRNGITGVLFYSDGHFLQVLEGESLVVRQIYDRIMTDSRHRDIVLLLNEPVARRDFDGWTMGWQIILPTDLKKHPEYEPYFNYFPEGANISARPGIALEMLTAFTR